LDTTLIKGLHVLEHLIQADSPLRITAIASDLDLPKSNVHRTLTTLIHAGYVVQGEDGSYRPTLRIWEQGIKVIARHPVRRAAHAFMQALNQETSETVNLVVLDGDECLYIHQITSVMPIRASSALGNRVPAIYPASGKVLLAYMPDGEKRARAIYNKYKSMKPGLKLNELLEDLERIKPDGYAYSISGWREGINSVAGVIFGPNRQPIAAIALSGPQERMTKERMEKLSHSVLNTCTQISNALGA